MSDRMERIILICSLLVICVFTASNGEVRTAMFRDHTYTFYNVPSNKRLSFYNAKQACSKAGSRLMEVYDSATDEFLRSNITITSQEWYYFGGKNPTGQKVTWDSGTQSSFAKWSPRATQEENNECFLMEYDGWTDGGCTLPQRYICESAPMRNFRLSSTQMTMRGNSVTNVTCQADAIPVPEVRWKFNSDRDVSKVETQGIYQVKSSGKSTLHLKNVRSENEGKYTCIANSNPRGVETSQNATFKLKVPSKPMFVTIDPVVCTTDITVKWKPSLYAVKTNHSILIISTTDESESYQEFITPITAGIQELEKSLRPWTSYSIKITPCPKEPCMTHYTASNSSLKKTEGIPGVVDKLTILQSGAQSCSLNWERPIKVAEGHITEYRIIVNESIANANNGSITYNILGNTTSYKFQGKINTTYWIAVQARTCAGYGDILWSSTSCTIPITAAVSGSTVLIIGIVVAVLALLIIVIGIILIIKKRNATTKTPNSSKIDLAEIEGNGNHTNHELSMNAMRSSATFGGAVEEPVYQNQEKSLSANDDSKTLISMKDLESVYNSMLGNQTAGFVAQFEELSMTAKRFSLSCDFAANPDFKVKNRYKDILPFDLTRVPIEGSKGGYINACFIDGYRRKKKFIATQGPLKKTVEDFWQMIVEQETFVIVMLAKCVEAGKKKCEKYWPDLGETTRFGAVTVSNLDETRFCGFVCRTLKVTAKNDGREWLVSQYHFLKWPDHGFPITTTHILQMHRKVAETYERSRKLKSPIVVHCSAGAGRTGTWVGYDNLLEESKSTGKIDIYGCVARMRRQRMEMVQNCNQYTLVHKLLLESYVFGDTDIIGREVPEKFSDQHYKSKTASQHFRNLSRIKPMDMLTTNKVTCAYDRMRIAFSDPNTFIEASYVEAYDESSQVIVAKAPTSGTLQAFWEIIMEKSVNTVVMITEGKQDTFKYWNHNSVDIVDEDIKGKYVIRKLKPNFQENVITQIHLQVTSEEGPRQTAIKINDCISRMLIELRESNGAALIHCKDGVGTSGVFCAVMNLLERLKVEDHVDVFRAVKDLRDCKEGMIPTTKGYELCYEAVLAYLQDFETYSNFK